MSCEVEACVGGGCTWQRADSCSRHRDFMTVSPSHMQSMIGQALAGEGIAQQHGCYLRWVFIKGGCSRRGVQRMGVVLYEKLVYIIIQITTPCFHCTPFDEYWFVWTVSKATSFRHSATCVQHIPVHVVENRRWPWSARNMRSAA